MPNQQKLVCENILYFQIVQDCTAQCSNQKTIPVQCMILLILIYYIIMHYLLINIISLSLIIYCFSCLFIEILVSRCAVKYDFLILICHRVTGGWMETELNAIFFNSNLNTTTTLAGGHSICPVTPPQI